MLHKVSAQVATDLDLVVTDHVYLLAFTLYLCMMIMINIITFYETTVMIIFLSLTLYY